MLLRFPLRPSAFLSVAAALSMSFIATGCDPVSFSSTASTTATLATSSPKFANRPSATAERPTKSQREDVSTPSDARRRNETLSIASGADELKLTPMEYTRDARGNAILSLRFDNHRERPARLTLNVDGRVYAFGRHKSDPSWYSGWIDFDFDLFAKEQAARGQFNAEMKIMRTQDEAMLASFSGRQFKSEAPLSAVEPISLDNARRTSSTLAIDATALEMLPGNVSPPRELLINDLRVVRDSTRTFDICNNFGNPNGAWTFRRLTAAMANTAVTGINASTFVENWLKEWSTGQLVNGETIAARTAMRDKILTPWPRLANGDLDLSKSPFRLLAIVNRVDLRKNTADGLDAGEMRFVFSAVDRTSNVCAASPFIVILEYKVPIQGCQAVKNYANRWISLGDLAIGSTEFNTALESLTISVTRANAAPNSLNGSAISQVRSNEVLLGFPWQLREFRLASDGQLQSFAVAQTPRLAHNNTALLGNYMTTNSTAILGHRHTVPFVFSGSAFRAGAITNGGSDFWRASSIGTNTRHAFSLDTCNGCHGGETKTAGDVPFVHIEHRAAASTSRLSKFMVGDGPLSSPTTYTMTDPLGGSARQLGDLARRRADLATLANSTCTASGLLSLATFKEVTAPH